MKRRKKSVIL